MGFPTVISTSKSRTANPNKKTASLNSTKRGTYILFRHRVASSALLRRGKTKGSLVSQADTRGKKNTNAREIKPASNGPRPMPNRS